MRGWIVFLLMCGQAFGVTTPTSESDYLEAVVAYQKQDLSGALDRLDAILESTPDHLKALELKGLILKERGDKLGALQTFAHLKELATDRALASAETGQPTPPANTAPYEFEAGLLLFEMKRYAEARPLLVNSVKAGFNAAPAKYFLGLAAFHQNEDSEAQSHFRYVVRTKSDLLRASAYYYLGVIAKKRDDTKQALYDWREAKAIAQTLLADNTVTENTHDAASSLLDRVNSALNNQSSEEGRKEYFANVALITSYDSNILLSPLIDEGATGVSTVMETLRYATGYTWKWDGNELTPTVRGSWNYNFHPDAHGGEFLITDAALTYTRNSALPFHWGVRGGVQYIMRRTTGVLSSQSLGFPTSGFLRRMGAHWGWTGEFIVTPQQFFTDDSLDRFLAKTGIDWRIRNSIQYGPANRYFNPTLSVDVFVTQTNGEEFRNRGFGAALSNSLHFNRRTALHLRAAWAYSEYPVRPGAARYDNEIMGSAQVDYKLWRDLHLLGEFSYLENLSTVTDFYRYNRWVASLGADYRF